MSYQDENNKAKRVFKTFLAVVALVVLFALGWVSMKVADHASDKKTEELVAEAEASQKAEQEQIENIDGSSGSRKSDLGISNLPGESGLEVTMPEADFGSRVEGDITVGEDLQHRLMSNTGDLEYYVGVSSEQVDSESCYSTTKGYVVCDLGDGYHMILENHYQTVFAVAKTEGDFSDIEVRIFKESYPTATQVEGSGALEGLAVLTKNDPTDIS